MATALLVRDETATGTTTHSFTLDVESTRMTVRELIIRRVEAEVEAYNRRGRGEDELPPQSHNGLVQAPPSGVIANATMEKHFKPLDAASQCARAVEGFESNSFFILLGDCQPASLDETIEIEEGTEVAFVRLMPLVGG